MNDLNKSDFYYELSKLFCALAITTIVVIFDEVLREMWYLFFLSLCGTFFILFSFFSKEKEKVEIIISCIIITIGMIISCLNRTNEDTIIDFLFYSFLFSTIIASLFFSSKIFSEYKINSI